MTWKDISEKCPKALEKFQNISENPKALEKCPKALEKFQNISEILRL